MRAARPVRRRFLFIAALAVLIVCAVDVAASLVFRVVRGSFFWDASSETSVFNVWPFTELVPDDRIITLKKSFTYVDAPPRQSRWTMTTDPNGFRVGDYRYFTDRPNIVFLGDSVPFGWGVEDNESVPSAFRRLMPPDRGLGVINAAVPSYSLYQAVKRFEYEITPRWPVAVVIVQVYDPVGQFLIWGRQWDEKMSWSSKDTLASTREITQSAMAETSDSPGVHCFWGFLMGHSATVSVLKGVWSRAYGERPLAAGLDVDDAVAFGRFESQNTQRLEALLSSVRAAKAKLVLLPTNPRRHLAQYDRPRLGSVRSRTRKNLVAVDSLNRIFERFASTYADTYYLDLVASFDGQDRATLYLRDGLHLSPLGSEREARFIFEELKRHGLM
jgi:hypothetical protein